MIRASDVDDGLARFHLLASAVAGRSVRVARASDGERSFTDGQTIYLASGGDRRADLSGIAAQGALLAAGSLDAEIMLQLVGRSRLARRYLTIEGWRALASIAELLPGVPLVAEARRVELVSSSPNASLAEALSRRPVGEPPDLFGVIRPRRVLAVASDEESVAPAPKDLPQPEFHPETLRAFDEDENEDSEELKSISKLFSSPLQIRLVSWLAEKMGIGRTPGSGGADLPFGASRSVTPPTSKGASFMLPGSLLPSEVVFEQGHGWRYPEWDSHTRRYRPDWCTVLEVDPHPDDLQVFDIPPGGDVRRHLARLGVGLERRRRQSQGDDIDIDAAVESRVELLAGTTPDEAVYVESQRCRRSLAVLFLLDISGSSAERTSALGSVHQHQRVAAAVLLDALHALGDRVALYGFRSRGASAVYMVRVKSFEDALDGAAYERLGGLVPAGYTRLGAAIRHAAYLLDTRAGTERRLLVVLSDGLAYDDAYEGRYGEADARRALAETRRQGIGCLCLTLGASTDPDALRRVFGSAAHAQAGRLEELVPDLGPLFRRAMASADLQRRLAQRHQRAEAPRGAA